MLSTNQRPGLGVIVLAFHCFNIGRHTKYGAPSLSIYYSGVGFLVNNKWKDNITRVPSGNSRVAEPVLRITDIYQLKIVQVYAPRTSHSDEETDNFYNTINNILEKQTHYTIVMGDFNAKVGGQTHTSERATRCFTLGQQTPERKGGSF